MKALRLARRIPGARPVYRALTHLWFNSRDFFDAYLAPARATKHCPLGFEFGGTRSTHHLAMQEGTFEPQEVRWLSSVLPQVDIFVDVGANVGYFTCLARHLGKPAVAIEPMPRNLAFLLGNLTANGWEDTEVVAAGVSDRIGIVTLFGASSTGASLVANWAGAPSSFARSIPVTTLDTILVGRFLDRRLLIKMDVEGHEYRALLGGRSLLDRQIKPIWLIEITGHQYHPSGRNPDFEPTFELLWQAGYRSLSLDGSGIRTVDAAAVRSFGRDTHGPGGAVNYIFIPPDFDALADAGSTSESACVVAPSGASA